VTNTGVPNGGRGPDIEHRHRAARRRRCRGDARRGVRRRPRSGLAGSRRARDGGRGGAVSHEHALAVACNAIGTIDERAIEPAAAVHGVGVARAGGGPVARVDEVVSGAADERVTTVTVDQPVGARTTEETVVARTAEDRVRARTTVEAVAAAQSAQHVIPATSEEDVRRGRSGHQAAAVRIAPGRGAHAATLHPRKPCHDDELAPGRRRVDVAGRVEGGDREPMRPARDELRQRVVARRHRPAVEAALEARGIARRPSEVQRVVVHTRAVGGTRGDRRVRCHRVNGERASGGPRQRVEADRSDRQAVRTIFQCSERHRRRTDKW
jgi:hypothetical protein